MDKEGTGLGIKNKNERSGKNFTSIIINGKDNKFESSMNKGKKNSKFYYEDPVDISPLDNASNRANEIAKEMKNRENKEKNRKESSVLGATFIRD
eukprot:jgi/Orpsp1_1/1174797/evm.model.c7180000051456.1